MDSMSPATPRFVLCRECANFTGRRAGLERRQQPTRLCAAGLPVRRAAFDCESHVRMVVFDRSARGGVHSKPGNWG
jgi:hypothetical protein